MTTISDILSEGSRLFQRTTKGKWTTRVFVSAPASEKAPAIETRKITPIQRTPLGSLKAGDADFIVFVHENWPAIAAALKNLPE